MTRYCLTVDGVPTERIKDFTGNPPDFSAHPTKKRMQWLPYEEVSVEVPENQSVKGFVKEVVRGKVERRAILEPRTIRVEDTITPQSLQTQIQELTARIEALEHKNK